MNKYEYAVFTVRLPWNAPWQTPWHLDDWPFHQELINALVVEMNKLGEDGWEVFDRAHPAVITELLPGSLFPFNLWARRLKVEAGDGE